MKYNKGFKFIGEYNLVCVIDSYTKDDYLKDGLYVVTYKNGFWTYRESEIEYMVKLRRINKIDNILANLV